MTVRSAALGAALAAALLAAPPALAADTLVGRAILPSDAYQAGPASGALLGTSPINGVTPPFPGQPIPGFSAVLSAGGDLLAMPDNGYGSKANSPDFLLRLYRVDPDYRTAAGGSGAVEVKRFVSLDDSSVDSPRLRAVGG